MDTWTVVSFVGEGSVEAVPTKWIIGDMCYFPATTKQKTTAAIIRNEHVNMDWPSYKIRTFREGTYDNYIVARNKAKIAEDTSDLNSDLDMVTQMKKKRKIHKINYSDSDSKSYYDRQPRSQLPPIPRMTSLPTFSKSTTQQSQKVAEASVIDNNRIIIENTHESIVPGSIIWSGMDNNDGIWSGMDNNEGICNNACNKCCKQNNLNSVDQSVIKNLGTQCHLIRNIVMDILQDVKEMKQSFNGAKEPMNEEINNFYEFMDITFPINGLGDLEAFEGYLNDKNNFDSAARQLARCGGNSSYEFIKRAMTPLISDNLAMQFNWQGKKNKRKFADLLISKLIIEADRIANISATQKETEIAIVAWLKRSKERISRLPKNF